MALAIKHLGVEPIVSTLMGWLAAEVGISHASRSATRVSPRRTGRGLIHNNAVNHGIFTTLGIQEAHIADDQFSSWLSRRSRPPAPGLLLACQFFGSRQIVSHSGAIIIHTLWRHPRKSSSHTYL